MALTTAGEYLTLISHSVLLVEGIFYLSIS